jgi:voltage-gated potassium channel
VSSILDSLYFTIVTCTTLGYGDITPATWAGKILVSFEILWGVVIMTQFLGAITAKAARK